MLFLLLAPVITAVVAPLIIWAFKTFSFVVGENTSSSIVSFFGSFSINGFISVYLSSTLCSKNKFSFCKDCTFGFSTSFTSSFLLFVVKFLTKLKRIAITNIIPKIVIT